MKKETTTKVKYLRVRLLRELHDLMKYFAMREQKTVQSLVEQIIAEYLAGKDGPA